MRAIISRWSEIREAYKNKDRSNSLYYLSNASGQPPRIAKEKFDWPSKRSISDSKTSAGLDRTDDIKKGIYQTLKLGILAQQQLQVKNIKTALISNLPAYRHGPEYLEPFYDILWTFEDKMLRSTIAIDEKFNRCFDYIICLEYSFLRGDLLWKYTIILLEKIAISFSKESDIYRQEGRCQIYRSIYSITVLSEKGRKKLAVRT
ncbi:hypothetical protein POG22_10770 [Geitlerinema sp. CS-897]|nr:hypothetical protein [Geitlerinema sp. CS-897]